METSAIAYRVVDFLKAHPPFQAVADTELLELAAHGRVRFYEPREYLVWQGEPHKSHVFVIQQGTVSLWDEGGGDAVLKDVRGPGDLLAAERFNGAPSSLYSALSESDVVIYSFPAHDFEELLARHPQARQFVAALDTVSAEYHATRDSREPQKLFLKDVVVAGARLPTAVDATIAEVARTMLERGSTAVAIVDAERAPLGVVTVDRVLAWVAAGGGGAATAPVRDLVVAPVNALEPSATVADAVLAVARSRTGAVVMTSDGTPRTAVHAVVTAAETARAFGDQPNAIVAEIGRAATIEDLRTLNHRARAFILRQATSAAALDWLAHFAALVDDRVVERVLHLCGWHEGGSCWCCIGASGRAESLTRHAPQLALITRDDLAWAEQLALFERVSDALIACDYMQRTDISFDRAFHVASASEWITRYRRWLGDPIRSSMYLARQMFDLRPLHGDTLLWREVTAAATSAIDGGFLQVLANDCLANLPPLTFFQDAVVEKSGEQTTTFRLEESALRPLVDVGRVFGMAARNVFGTSTLERLSSARSLLPEHEFIFREAADTMRILLWQQARIGIDQNTSGSELPPSLLSRHDRHILKGGFRSILRLVEFTGPSSWVASI